MSRSGGGARGRAGSRSPSTVVGSPAWHESNRANLAGKAAAHRERAAARKAKLHPPEHHGGFTCSHCGWGGWHLHRVAAAGGGHHPTLAFQGCAHCGTMHPTQLHLHKTQRDEIERRDAIAKTIDSSETPLQRESVETVGHRSNCPRGGAGPCGAAQAGRCTVCRASVQDHEAIGKTLSDTAAELRKVAGL